MRLLLALLLLMYTANAKLSEDLMNDWNQIASPYAAECVQESGANPIIATNVFKDRRLADEEHVRCFIKCINDRYGITSPDGMFHVDKWLSTIKHLTPEVADTCYKKYVNEKDLCKKSYEMAVCVAEQNYVTE